MQNFTVVQCGIQEEIGPRQNKQTLNYLVDKREVGEWRQDGNLRAGLYLEYRKFLQKWGDNTLRIDGTDWR